MHVPHNKTAKAFHTPTSFANEESVNQTDGWRGLLGKSHALLQVHRQLSPRPKGFQIRGLTPLPSTCIYRTNICSPECEMSVFKLPYLHVRYVIHGSDPWTFLAIKTLLLGSIINNLGLAI